MNKKLSKRIKTSAEMRGKGIEKSSLEKGESGKSERETARTRPRQRRSRRTADVTEYHEDGVVDFSISHNKSIARPFTKPLAADLLLPLPLSRARLPSPFIQLFENL